MHRLFYNKAPVLYASPKVIYNLNSVKKVTNTKNHKSIAIWLFACCAAVFCMVVLGGATRLTGSGLSMVDWAPIMGILPPLDQTQWEEVFRQYQQFPEYKIKNHYMGLEEFKGIFWFEYAHRLLGRLIGVIFLVPLLYFSIRGRIDRRIVPKLVAMFILGGLQGLLGWYMVKSGLVKDPYVSQYRLTAHLGLALLIYIYMFWVALGLLRPGGIQAKVAGMGRLKVYTFWVTGLVVITALSGGFVA
ncbi:MAG: heme A synthase, partial [Gammaproteobacteria bacterium]|nr:heme A synthase [Gammaproteobacteria bacterium]